MIIIKYRLIIEYTLAYKNDLFDYYYFWQGFIVFPDSG